MKLSDMIKDIQETIEMFGDYELDEGQIHTDNVDITAKRINKFTIVVDEENKTATVKLMS